MIFTHYVFLIIDIIIIIAPTVGYVDTIRIMIKNHSADFYNLNTNIIIFFAQGSKVLYYCYHRFAFRIFGQSITLLIVATIMTFLRFRYIEKKVFKSENGMKTKRNLLIYYLDIMHSESYLDFCLSLMIYIILTYSAFLVGVKFIGLYVVTETLGLISNLMESSTSLPTFVRVVIHKDVATVSPVLVAQYLTGDLMKIILYVFSKTPWSFIFSAFCQLTVDIVTFIFFIVLGCMYSKKTENENTPFVGEPQN